MKRRDFLQAASTGVICATTSCSSILDMIVAARKPNFVIIFADDQGYGDLSCYGSNTISTPQLDRMTREGMKFTSFYVAAAVCSPSRAALMTACYPRRVGLPEVLWPNSMSRGQRDGMAAGINANEKTMAEMFKEHGYATACFGKWHLGNQPEYLPTRHGFDEYFGLPYSNDMHPPNKRTKYPPLPLIRNEQVVETDPDQALLTRRYTDEAIRFIRENKARPFFLYVPHTMPHRPIRVSERFRKRFTEEQLATIKPGSLRSADFLYAAAIEEIDWNVGRIMDTLDKLGLDERTFVVYTSDNGPSAGNAGALRGGKAQMFEGGLRVPCIMRWPGKIPAGTVCDEMCLSMDLYPTFARLVGAEMPGDRVIDGKDIWPILSGRPGAKTPHEAFFYMHPRSEEAMAVRSGKWKLHVKVQPRVELDVPALYDLENDIGETTNLADKYPAVVRRLTKMIGEFNRELRTHSRPCGRSPVLEG